MSTQSKKGSLFDLSVRGRMFAGFATLMLPVVVVIFIFLFILNGIQNTATRITNVDIPIGSTAASLGSEINATQAVMYDFLLTNNAQATTNFTYAWNDIADTQKEMETLAAESTDRNFKDAWSELKKQYDPLRALQEKAMTIPRDANHADNVTKLIANELRPLRTKMINIIDGQRSSVSGKREGGMINLRAEHLAAKTKGLVSDISTLDTIGYGLLVISIILSITISVFTARSISNPLGKATDIAKKIASGERHIDIEVTSNDEIGELQTALRTMLIAIKDKEDSIRKNEENTKAMLDEILHTAETYSAHSSKLASGDLRLRLEINKDDVLSKLGKDLNSLTGSMSDTAGKIAEASNNIVTTLEEVRAAANAQSTGVTEQASSIQEITASLEEIDKSSKQTMQKAQTLGDVAKQTRDKGNLGIQSVEKSIQGMNLLRDKMQAISQSILDLSMQTQQVGEITAVVNTLAQQSKMLALNASIEAAKAGEAGKGFAVVAIEVKNLAEQSEQSTAQVQKILEDIRRGAEKSVMVSEEGARGVDESSKLIENASEVIHNLNNMISEASIASQQIEASIRQEAVSIEQITAGMNEINQVTSSFVTSVKETSTAINYLADIGVKLKELIAVYKF